jgi:hypothetical protein
MKTSKAKAKTTSLEAKPPTLSSANSAAEPGAKGPPDAAPQSDWREKAIEQAWNAREMLIATNFSLLVGKEIVDATAAKVLFNSFLRDAGDPVDPVERILLEQLLLTHYRLAQLQIRADAADSAEYAKVLNGAANRLLGELRRLALAIRVYRQPASAKSFNVVHQQNVVASGSQQVAYTDQSTPGETRVSLKVEDRGELGDKQADEGAHEPGSRLRRYEESSPGLRGKAQRLHAAAVDG